MKRLYIVVEGQTEEAFVNHLIAPYLRDSHQIWSVTPILIKTSSKQKGGFSNYEHLRRDLLRLLREQDVVVSMFVDFFRCPETPGKEFWFGKVGHLEEVEERERQIALDIANDRFIPYIQLHEFEALLFASSEGFASQKFNPHQIKELQQVCREFPNPEDINTSPEGAPSKRLLRVVPDYHKVKHGRAIAQMIGLQVMLNRCPRFAAWVERLIEACQ